MVNLQDIKPKQDSGRTTCAAVMCLPCSVQRCSTSVPEQCQTGAHSPHCADQHSLCGLVHPLHALPVCVWRGGGGECMCDMFLTNCQLHLSPLHSLHIVMPPSHPPILTLPSSHTLTPPYRAAVVTFNNKHIVLLLVFVDGAEVSPRAGGGEGGLRGGGKLLHQLVKVTVQGKAERRGGEEDKENERRVLRQQYIYQHTTDP